VCECEEKQIQQEEGGWEGEKRREKRKRKEGRGTFFSLYRSFVFPSE